MPLCVTDTVVDLCRVCGMMDQDAGACRLLPWQVVPLLPPHCGKRHADRKSNRLNARCISAQKPSTGLKNHYASFVPTPASAYPHYAVAYQGASSDTMRSELLTWSRHSTMLK